MSSLQMTADVTAVLGKKNEYIDRLHAPSRQSFTIWIGQRTEIS